MGRKQYRRLNANTNHDAFANYSLPQKAEGESSSTFGNKIGSEYSQRAFPHFDKNIIPEGLKRPEGAA